MPSSSWIQRIGGSNRFGGLKERGQLYKNFNTLVPMASPGSNVLTEINRGTAANMMEQRGQFELFRKYGGTPLSRRGTDFPSELIDMIGHPYHWRGQVGPMSHFVDTREVNMMGPKVPLYSHSSGVPEIGFQTKLPVPDMHFTRSIGMSDVRRNASPGASMTMAEFTPIGPWFRENVAVPLDIEAISAQQRQWGVFGPQTGLRTAIGAPKLELLSQRIWEMAKNRGIDPLKYRDEVLSGRAHAGIAGAIGLGAAGLVEDGEDR